MDVRTKIINNVLESLVGLETDVLQKVEHSLHIQLKDYEIQERCTEMIVHDDTNMGLLKKFLATKRLEGKSERTIEKYRPELENLIHFTNKKICDMNAYDLRLYLAVYKEKRNVSNRTLENMRKTISSFFGWLQSEGFIIYNPAKALNKIKYDKKYEKSFSPVEREKIKNVCTNPRDLALVEFLYTSGLRVSEVSSLNIDNIDFVSREATVIGKGGKERKFYISQICSLYLMEYIKNRNDENPALFVSIKHPFNRLSKSGIEAILKRIGKNANVDNVHPHRFRRTLATDLVKKNVPIQEVAEILGHCDLRTTQVYVCLDKESIKYHYNKVIS